MSWFRRTAKTPPVEAYAGTTVAELESWLRARLVLMRRPGRDVHHLVLTAPGDLGWFVQVLGMTDSARLEVGLDGATIPPSAEGALRSAGWLPPEPASEWPFWWAESSLDDGGVEQAVRLARAAASAVLGVQDGRVDIRDEPYDRRR